MSSNNHSENKEIERKFLVSHIPFDNLNAFESHYITQCYISTSPTLRLRRWDNDYIFTFKGGSGIEHTEFEYKLTKEEYANLIKKSETKILEKRRYIIPLENNLKAELDIYYGELEGFMNVEVEFADIVSAKAFKAPEWFGEEVSEDKRYSNAYLVKFGVPVKI